jgi:translation initiation factor IF-3
MKELEDVGTAEAMPKMEKRRMNVMIAPKKRKKSEGKKKKGPKKADVDLTKLEEE